MALGTYILSETASTKRPPALSGGKRGEAVANVASMRIAPPAPVDSETKTKMEINTPYKVFLTYAERSVDLAEGDLLVYGSVEYPIVRLEAWSFAGFSFYQIYIEELKR